MYEGFESSPRDEFEEWCEDSDGDFTEEDDSIYVCSHGDGHVEVSAMEDAVRMSDGSVSSVVAGIKNCELTEETGIPPQVRCRVEDGNYFVSEAVYTAD